MRREEIKSIIRSQGCIPVFRNSIYISRNGEQTVTPKVCASGIVAGSSKRQERCLGKFIDIEAMSEQRLAKLIATKFGQEVREKEKTKEGAKA